MDLIYADSSGKDQGILQDYTLDMAYGTDENSWKVSICLDQHCMEAGYIIYFNGTEYGGIVDSIYINTADETIEYSGRTWHGLLDSKVICPDEGEDYLILSGDANAIIGGLISRLGLGEMFQASAEESGITITSYQMDRYITGYQGINKMLKKNGAKLCMAYDGAKVTLSAKALHDYSQDDEFSQDQMAFEITRNYAPVNHVICLGTGELAERTVLHLYADADGNISYEQSLTGMDEVTQVYDYANAESDDDLEEGGREIIEDSYAEANAIDVDFENNDTVYDVNDKVGATEQTTGISAAQYITKKIIKVEDYEISIEYEIG